MCFYVQLLANLLSTGPDALPHTTQGPAQADPDLGPPQKMQRHNIFNENYFISTSSMDDDLNAKFN